MTDGSAPHPPTAPGPGPTPADRRRAPTRARRRLAAAGLAGIAVVVAVTLAVRGGAAPACAAPPVGGATHTGKATFYDSKGAGGNCSRPAAPANRLYVALGPSEYAAGAACGGFLDVTGPRGTVRVLVMDQCPECAPGHLDLSAEAFARIADPVRGVVEVSYRAVVDPSLPGPLTFRLKEGASQWWFAVLVGDHGNPLRAVEVRQNGAWRSADREDYNYWLIPSGAGPGPYAIRVTDVYGHRVTAAGIRMLPGQVQRSTTRMYGAGAAGATRAAKPTRSLSARPTPRVSASPSPTRPAPTRTPLLLDAALPATSPTVRTGCG
ncbi:expansin EXLX1 family cellulose-binding protein [Micromonospora sp. WMMD980]|uniref:expansin EXLX1 family cellulose-binding protein n=1 Tax=Micromonospora sp. WMMD980 TaxID=3016088 RepID=UPI002416FD5E|nr:expansin EXLX1 family cellulose-binding protein [Micromonospora sp. WMMD980]MDG4802568.1 expansin EXLX1 family cellulose-binding protein [Micromonospora sp. WMMD980]